MTKQEIIREGLVELCRERTTGAGKVLASTILTYLHENDVAIKKEGAVPGWLKFKWAVNSCMINQSDVDEDFEFDLLEDAEYTLTEPLIEQALSEV